MGGSEIVIDLSDNLCLLPLALTTAIIGYEPTIGWVGGSGGGGSGRHIVKDWKNHDTYLLL